MHFEATNKATKKVTFQIDRLVNWCTAGGCQRSSISRHGCPAFHQQAISSILNNFIDKLSAEVRFGECKVDVSSKL
ncbi:hypothetical protein T08_6365 [Trichinella sp. T8]|nr:hypothetical protein T08_6365 [Trichinella sp. T8]